MNKYDGILMASGGMDSTVMAYWLKKQNKKILPLFIDYGQHCKEVELETLKSLLPSSYVENLRVINIKDIYSESISRVIVEPNLWVDDVVAEDLDLPFRNLLLISIALVIAELNGIDTVYSAFIDSNLAKEIDCSEEFFEKLRDLIDLYNTVKIVIPFSHYTKSEVARLGIKLQVPILETFSCQINSKVHCGVCPNCVDRQNALKNLEV